MEIKKILIFIYLLGFINSYGMGWIDSRKWYVNLDINLDNNSPSQKTNKAQFSDGYGINKITSLLLLSSISISNFQQFKGFKVQIDNDPQYDSVSFLGKFGDSGLNALSYKYFGFTYPRIEGFVANVKVTEILTITRVKKISDVLVFIQDMPLVKLQNQAPITFDLQKTITKVTDYQYEISYISSCIQEINFSIIIAYNPIDDNVWDSLYEYLILLYNGAYLNIPFDVQPIFGLNNFMIQSDNIETFSLSSTSNRQMVMTQYSPHSSQNMLDVSGFLLMQLICSDILPIINVKPSLEVNCDNQICTQNNFIYNPDPSQISAETVCWSCNPNCESCKDMFPNKCNNCVENKYLNLDSLSCEDESPPDQRCTQQQNSAGKSYFLCGNCDPSCKECSEFQNPKSCLSCNPDSAFKYLYNKQCMKTQPDSTFCDKNNVCYDCHPNCSSCQDISDFCLKCKVNKFFYKNKCLDSKPAQAFCVYKYY